jgi:hypothetical protein
MNIAKEMLDKINKKNGGIWNDKDKLLLCLMFIADHTEMDAFEEFLVDAAANDLTKEIDDDDDDDDEEEDDDIDDDDDEA